jgi:hypothetical protein
LPPVKFCFAAKPYQIRLKSDVLFYLTVIKEFLEVSATISIFLRKNQNYLLPEKPPMNIGVKIERFLLQPEIISILEERIKSGKIA